MKILKFGGTSVGSPYKMTKLLDIINPIGQQIVVLSAVAGTTDRLVEIACYCTNGNKNAAKACITKLCSVYGEFVSGLFTETVWQKKANAIINEVFTELRSIVEGDFFEREEKIILSFGELLSTQLYHTYLQSIGVESVLLSALDFVRTNDDGEPDIKFLSDKLGEILKAYPSTQLFITQGFICRSSKGDIDNLKRGGSDYTASLIGAAVGAEEIQIWTDISGMHNNDPRIVKDTERVACLSYEEAAELAYFGAKILHPQCVFPARKFNIPLRLLNTMQPDNEGTLITKNSERQKIKSIAAKDGITAIKVQSNRLLLTHSFLSRVFEVFHRYKTPVDIITTSEVAVSLTIDQATSLPKICNELKELGEVSIDEHQTIICVVGDFRTDSKGYASEVFAALEQVPIRMISYGGSSFNISLVVSQRDKEVALNSLHKHLFPKSTQSPSTFINTHKTKKNKMNKTTKLTIGLFGFGTVGEGLYQVLRHTPSLRGEIRKIVIKHPHKKRNAPIDLFTTNAAEVLNDEHVNVVVELIDDAAAAYNIVATALRKGKAVVSANKKMIAEHLPELLELQRIHKVPFLYESAACASIPVIRNLEEYYDNDLLHGLQGIVNGSTNYILTKIANEGISFADALTQAQEAGFAESDPSLDINGIDAVNKLAILLVHAYGIVSLPKDIVHGGIQNLHPGDSVVAREKGYTIKLIAQARKLSSGKVAAFVMPQFVPSTHLLAPVKNEYNGIIIESSLAENQFFYGKGAGGVATASAVLSDLSALRYDYRYEYKKLYDHTPSELSSDFFLRVYVSFEGLSEIPVELFERIDECTTTSKKTTVTGILHFSKLLDTSWWQNRQTSIILYPDAILDELPTDENEAVKIRQAFA